VRRRRGKGRGEGEYKGGGVVGEAGRWEGERRERVH